MHPVILPVTLYCILCSCTSSCPFYTTKNKGDKTQTLQESFHLHDIFLGICEHIIEIWNLKMTLPCSLHSSKVKVYIGGSMWSQTDFMDSEQLKHALIFNRHIGDRHLPLTMVRAISKRFSYTTKKGRHYRTTLQLPNIDFRWKKWPDSLYFVNQIWGFLFSYVTLIGNMQKKNTVRVKGSPPFVLRGLCWRWRHSTVPGTRHSSLCLLLPEQWEAMGFILSASYLPHLQNQLPWANQDVLSMTLGK